MRSISTSRYALMLHMIPHLGPKGIARLLNDVMDYNDGNIYLKDLPIWNMSFDSIRKEYGLHAQSAHCLVNDKGKLIDESEKLHRVIDELGISIISMLDADYPPALKEYLSCPPPIIYAYGNLSLFGERKYAIANSSNMSTSAIERTREISSILAELGLAIVTSHNTLSYQISGLAAKARNASTVMVLDRGILNVFPKGMAWEPMAQARIWNPHFDNKKDLVISQFRLYDHWIGSNSRERDKTVFALADILVGIDIRPGGFMESECLRAGKKGREVYIYRPDENIPAGNEFLINKGLKSISASWASSFLKTVELPHDDFLKYDFEIEQED